MNAKKIKIFITGGAGYIGSTLTPILLKEGYEVTVYDNFLFNQNSLLDCCSNPHFKIIRGDICNFHEVKKLVSKDYRVVPGGDKLTSRGYLVPLTDLTGV